MFSLFLLSSLIPLISATPQGPWLHGGGGGVGGPGVGGPFGSLPSCVTSCPGNFHTSSYQSQCSNSTAIDSLNSCIASSSCSDADKFSAYSAIAQVCANAGTTLTASPEASIPITTTGPVAGPWPTTWASGSTPPWGSAYSSWTSAHGTAPYNGTWGGSGPFGGPNGGWGAGPWGTGRPWTSGPWTSWWGNGLCPPGNWTGWTSGPWSTSAPWTSWTACEASTTATRTVTTTVTVNGGETTQAITRYEVQVNQASATRTTLSSSNAATPTSAVHQDVLEAMLAAVAALMLAR